MVQALTDTRSLRVDTLLQGGVDESDLTWRVLGTLNVFRMVLALVLLGLFFAGDDPRLFGDRYPALFSATAAPPSKIGSKRSAVGCSRPCFATSDCRGTICRVGAEPKIEENK